MNFIKKIFGAILISLFFVNSANAIGFNFAEESGNSEQNFFTTRAEISAQNSQLSSLKIEKEFLQKSENSFEKNLQNEKNFLQKSENLLDEISEKIEFEKSVADENSEILKFLKIEETDLKTEIKNSKQKIENLEKKSADFEKNRAAEISQKENEITKLENEIAKNNEIARIQFFELLKKIGVFIFFILLALIFRKIFKRTILKYGAHFSQKRQKILIKTSNILFFSVVSIAVGAVLFSQFAVILPFVALLGTGVAFAIRDVISSFLAWFFIGTRTGFKIGDLVEIGNEGRGRVLEINLIHTILAQTGERGATGNILQIPNKKIFENKVVNFSKMYRFSWAIFNFLLEKNSNISKTKQLLIESIQKVAEEDFAEIHKNLPSLSRRFSFSEEDLLPKIFVELRENGIFVKTKFFCRLQHRHIFKTRVCEEFLQKVKNENDIFLRFLER